MSFGRPTTKGPPPTLARIGLELRYAEHDGMPARSAWALDMARWTDDEVRHVYRVLQAEVKRRKAER